MNVRTMKITEQIRLLVDRDEIVVEAAIVLMLTAQMEILERMENIEERLKKVEDMQNRYPSATWLWAFRRREVIVLMVIIALIYTFIFSPWLISDIRHAVLDLLGLPMDMGIGGP